MQRITMDLGYKRLLGDGSFKYGPRPDVGVLYKSGSVKAIEVASKTDVFSKLYERNSMFMLNNGITGSTSISQWALRINRFFPK